MIVILLNFYGSGNMEQKRNYTSITYLSYLCGCTIFEVEDRTGK